MAQGGITPEVLFKMVLANMQDANKFVIELNDQLDNTGLSEIDDLDVVKELLQKAETARECFLDMMKILAKSQKKE